MRPDRQLPERPLTIDDARNPLLPWLRAAEDVPADYDDILYARSWALSHSPVETIGTLQAPSGAPERPRRDIHKEV